MSARGSLSLLLGVAALSGCVTEASAHLGFGRDAFSQGTQPVSGARLGGGLAPGRLRVGGHLGARASGGEGARWLADISAGGAFGKLRELPWSLYAVEVSGVLGTSFEGTRLAARGEFFLGADVTFVLWAWSRRTGIDRSRQLWLVNLIPQFVLGAQTRVYLDRAPGHADYTPTWDVTGFVGFRYHLTSELLDF